MKAIQSKLSQSLALLAILSVHEMHGQDSEETLPTLFIDGQQTANVIPVSTYETPISNLEFEPRVDLQSRNMGEAQGDVSIRGGTFEATGFRIGAATLIDPQTGHYFAEIPIAPEMLSGPEVLTGSNNAIYGFNSTAGTVSYSWSQIIDGGSLTIGGGDHELNFQRFHSSFTDQLSDSQNWTWGAEAEYSRSESEGTIEFGDHDFNRITGRLQLVGPNSQTDLFAGYQSKFFGWPELYAAPFGSNETENLKTRLFLINHQHSYAEASYWEATAYYRRHSDHYIYNRFNPNPAKPFQHETDVSSLGLEGLHAINDALALNYAAQFTTDEIESNSLTFGDFDSRSYVKLSLLPQYSIQLNETESLTFRVGSSFDDTNRDESKISIISDINWERTHTNGSTDRIYLAYSEASQVVGYTALNSDPTGYLFGGDSTLEHETSQNLEFGGELKRQNWSIEGAIFYRWDDDLVDWVYGTTINNRAANAVDISTFGVELIATKRWDTIEAIASYTFLDKKEDYGDETIQGSFYALNYAKHRVTLGAIWSPIEMIEIRIDNEWRSQEDNPARTSDDEAIFTHVSISVFPPKVKGLELFIAIDNVWDDSFEDVPGTPGRGDQYSAGLTYRW